MVHYQPSAQVPARRGGRAAGPTPAAGAASSAGRARAPGPPRRLCGAAVPPRRARPASGAEGGELFPALFMGLTWWRGKGWARRGPLCSLRTPSDQSLLRESRPGPGHLPPGMLGLQSPGVLWAGEGLLARGKQTSSRRRLCKVDLGLQYLAAQTCLVPGVWDSSPRLQTRKVV